MDDLRREGLAVELACLGGKSRLPKGRIKKATRRGIAQCSPDLHALVFPLFFLGAGPGLPFGPFPAGSVPAAGV